MQRISVIGNTGSGKSTVARALADRLGIPCIELDALHWGPGWTEATPEELVAKVAPIVAKDAWVIDGMYYRKIGGLVAGRADTVVWIDPPFLPMLLRVLRRSLFRILTRKTLYNGNRESFRSAFLSPDSLLMFALRTRPRRRELLAGYLGRPEFGHLRVLRFISTGAALQWARGERPDPEVFATPR